jgi:hypothetical protein
MPDGLKNNQKGNALEDDIADGLRLLGFNATARVLMDGRLGKTPYGGRTRLSVKVEPCESFSKGLGIDASSYTDSGSASQKIPYKLMNASGWHIDGAVILDGDGRGIEPARNWAKQFAKNQPTLVFVGTKGEFFAFMRDKSPAPLEFRLSA